jgi:hypothetical protein
MMWMQTYDVKRQIKELASRLPFPMTCGDMVVVARYMHCSPQTVELLEPFAPHEIFSSAADCINRCEELNLLLHERCNAPRELLCSPRG